MTTQPDEHARFHPFRPEGLGQRLAPFVAAGSLGALLLFGSSITRLPWPSTVALVGSLALVATLYTRIWDAAPRFVQALPLAAALAAVLWPGDGLAGPGTVATMAIFSGALLGAFLLPWHRLPRITASLPPLAVIAALLYAHLTAGTSAANAFPFILLVLLWLALHHAVGELIFGMAMSVFVFVTPPPGVSYASAVGDGLLYASVALLIGFSVAQLLGRLRQQAADTEMVEGIMRRILSDDPVATRAALCDGARRICGAAAAVLVEPDGDGALVPTGSAGMPMPDVRLSLEGFAPAAGEPLDDSPVRYSAVEAFLSEQPVFHADMSHLPDKLAAMALESRWVSSLAQPVIRDTEAVGVLWLSWNRPVARLTERTASNVSLVATEAAIVLQQADFLRRVVASEERLARIAATDPLTGMANRREFDHWLERTGHRRFAVIAVDVDNLKEMNDFRGHDAGDEALRVVGRVLMAAVRDGDLVARTGGDEFAALLPGASLLEAELVAERMRTAMHGATFAQGAVRISAGCAAGRWPMKPRDVLTAADAALYHAKETGRDRIASRGAGGRPALRARDKARADVAQLITSGRVHSVYQPVVRLNDAAVVGFEALARPDGAPADASVERLFAAGQLLGHARDLDWLCRRAAVHGAHALPSELPLFINVGIPALLDPLHDVDQMILLLRWAKREPQTVVLEITQRDSVRDLKRFEDTLTRYRAEGFRFALDDVGDGHATFEVLAVALPEFIKISGRFANVDGRLGRRSTIRAAVSFAAETGSHVIAEGLQTESSVETVRQLGVTLGQGHALGKPAAKWGEAELAGRVAVRMRAERSGSLL